MFRFNGSGNGFYFIIILFFEGSSQVLRCNIIKKIPMMMSDNGMAKGRVSYGNVDVSLVFG